MERSNRFRSEALRVGKTSVGEFVRRAEVTPPSTPAIKPSPTVTTPAGAGQFQTEAQAKSQCPADLVVWVNLTSKIYHFAGHKSYGTTKAGAYMCAKEATAQGFRASKTEKRPSA
jgi:hypothetical protein